MFEFINGTTCLKISPENGAIHSVTMNGKMVSSTSDRAFRIRLLAENGDYEMISDSDFQDFSLEGNTSLHWRKCRKFPGLEFMLKIRCAEYGSFLFRPSVTGIPSGFQLEWISAPVLGLPLDFETLYPHFEGFLQKAPPEAVHMEWETHFKFPGNCSYYPGECQMQFLAAWSEGSGIYFAADDPGHSIKYFGTAHRAEAPVMETYMDCFCGTETPGQDYELPYDLILRPFSGDWQNACEIYREWIEQDPAIRREFPLPEWLKESPVVIICPVRGGKSITGLPNGFIPYENMFPRIRHLAEQFNSKVMVLLMRWDHNGPWMPPYYWPPVGGAESFRRFRDLLHSEGHLLGVYGSGTYFTLKG
ncbi:MAG: hypothetical protein J6S58_05340, partial [Lentisphaeria bacterium]|nr:hypothetical protein [Lentisphaeria bacterium]